MFPSSHYPRPEYPRPERRRGFLEGVDWLNLNGPWGFRFDKDGRGTENRWFAPDGPEWREQIIVPFCWESLAAWGEADSAGSENYFSTRVFRNPMEVTRANHKSAPRYEIGWYRRRIEVPDNPHWTGKRVILTVGAADFFTDCWCNGHHLGRHEGGYTPFEFDLTDVLATGDSDRRQGVVVIRVEDPIDHAEQPVGKQWSWYTSTSGIWQTVFLEPRSAAHIDRFRVVADIETAKADFEVFCREAREGDEIVFEITAPDGARIEAASAVSAVAGHARVLVAVEPLFLWDPRTPHLYRLILRLRRAGEDLDRVGSYFGMRQIKSVPVEEPDAPGALWLNGKPLYLRGALYQSFHPEGVYTAGNIETIRRDINFAKEAGFDFLRIHIKIDDPYVLHFADTIGMMLMVDFPNFGEGGDTPLGRRRFEEMMRAAIDRDFNHPSLIAWCLFNETWGFGGQLELVKHFPAARAGQPLTPEQAHALAEPAPAPAKLANREAYKWVHAIWILAKALDPTRLVEDMSVVVWEHLHHYGHTETDVNSWHFYIDDYEKAKAHIEKVVAETYRGSSFNYIEGFAQVSQPLMNSEYGGVGALDGDRDTSWSFKFLTNELRRHKEISAYVYTQLHDVEWECNGLLNYDRTPKEFGFDPRIINQGDVLPINAAPISRLHPNQTVRIEVLSSHFSRTPRFNMTLHWRLSGIDSLGCIHQNLTSGHVPIPFTQYRVEPAHRIKLQMPSEPMLCTLWVGAIDGNGELAASNFVHFHAAPKRLPSREAAARRLILRRSPAAWAEAEWSDGWNGGQEAKRADICHGRGHGFFAWSFPLDPKDGDIRTAQRIRILCELSSRRSDHPQTDARKFPTRMELLLNGLRVFETILPDHPHDSRGALSYLRDDRGAYGYLIAATVEKELLETVAAAGERRLHLCCRVPETAEMRGGLTVYGDSSGRYPLGPTILVEW